MDVTTRPSLEEEAQGRATVVVEAETLEVLAEHVMAWKMVPNWKATLGPPTMAQTPPSSAMHVRGEPAKLVKASCQGLLMSAFTREGN